MTLIFTVVIWTLRRVLCSVSDEFHDWIDWEEGLGYIQPNCQICHVSLEQMEKRHPERY